MLNEYFELHHEKQKKAEAKHAFHTLLMQLPKEDLIQIANGDFSKIAFLGDPDCWLEKFKGTPFFEQAAALEQESLQLDMQTNAKRQEDDAIDGQRGALRVRRRLLELQAASSDEQASQEQAAAEEVAAAQAPAEPPPEEKPKAEKTTIETKTAASLFAEAGRILAQEDFSKVANMAALKSMGAGAAKFLKANPAAAIGAATGAAGGLMHGLQKDEHGNRSLLRGAAEGVAGGAIGAGVGHAGGILKGNLAHAKATGGTMQEAIGATGRQLKYQGGQAVDALKKRLSSQGAAPAAAPVTQAPKPGFAAPTPASGSFVIPRQYNPDSFNTIVPGRAA